jgi:predicted nucleic acid-binding protein
MNAVDTNVFVYALDADEPDKQAKAIDLIDRLTAVPSVTVLLWQVAGEFLSCLRRWQSAGRIAAADVDADLADLLATFPLVLPSPTILDRSLDLGRRFSLSHWDSMLVASCQVAGVDTLFSEDMDDGAKYDSVQVVSPFT